MLNNKSEDYNITVIDHTNQLKSELTLDDAILKFNCDLSKFDSVMLNQATYDTLTSYKQYKPAKSMLIITNNDAIEAKPINYSDYSSLNCKFATPEFSSDVFLDNIEITIYLTKREAKKLAQKLDKAVKKHSRITFNKRNDTRAKFMSVFNIKDKKNKKITVLLDPVFKKINALKVSHNPENVNNKDLSTFYKILKSIIGADYRHRILNANITRFDVTFDGDGYTVEDLLFSLNKGTYFKQFVNQLGEVESKIIGSSKALRVIIYNKILQANLKNETYVKTRFEITVRPFNIKKLGGLKFKHVNELTSVFSSLMIFDKSKVESMFGSKSIDWNIIKDFGVSALRRTKNNTDRVKLTNKLNKCELKVDDENFNTLLIKLLKDQLQALLYLK
ncbi:MAG: hypothetical protein ACI9LM_004240 [Alteromonadaceae bacterium]|jgi:hypothetical protein